MKNVLHVDPGYAGEMAINNVTLSPQNVREFNGRVTYSLFHPSRVSGQSSEVKALWPSKRKMKLLARKFLNCEYSENKDGRDGIFMFFEIDSGLPKEDRAAFFAAVCVHTDIVPK